MHNAHPMKVVDSITDTVKNAIYSPPVSTAARFNEIEQTSILSIL